VAATESMDLVALVRAHLEEASPDVLRALVQTFAETIMSAEAQVLCNAEYGEVSGDRTNSRNGYRARQWDTRAGTIDLALPKLARGATSPTGCSAGAGEPSSP
jgi:putative transposase